MIFRPDIKPPMWGPLDAVQYAVRENAERMGINPSNLYRVLPLYEKAGRPIDVISGFTLTGGAGNTWPGNCYRINGDNNEIYFNEPTPVFNAITIVCGFERITNNTTSDCGLYSDKTVANWASTPGIACIARRCSSSGGLTFKIGTYETYNNTSNLTPVGSYSNLAFVWEAAARQEIWQNGKEINYDLHNIATGYTLSSDNANIGTYYDKISDKTLNDNIHYFYVIKQGLTVNQIAQFNATPYALLMPVSRPVYFDLGAGVTFSASCGSTLSSSDIQASIARSLAASAAASLTSSDISVTTAASYLLSAACHASVSSSDILVSILRSLTADSTASTTSSDILAAIARILIASADGSLTGSDIAVSIAAQKIFEAACNASLQSTDVLASILRQVSAQCNSSLTSQDITLAILRQLVASCAGSLSASDITVSTVAQKLFEAACAASLTSADSNANVARPLSCNCNGVVSSSDATLTIAGLLTFMAECAASTTGSDVTASISRVLSADSTVSIASSDISVFNLITLAATCDPTISATDAALNLRMYLQAVCAGTLSASDASIHVAALLSAACGAVVSSRDILVLFTDEIILPELFDAFSRITTSLDGVSRITATLDGYSRVDRSAN